MVSGFPFGGEGTQWSCGSGSSNGSNRKESTFTYPSIELLTHGSAACFVTWCQGFQLSSKGGKGHVAVGRVLDRAEINRL